MDTPPNARHAAQRIVVTLCGQDWILERDTDLETLWEALGETDFGEDERLPYWAELWPASLVLARWLARNRNRIAGRPCLDLGCGMGLTALVGASLGAAVTGLDYEWPAVRSASRNTALNRSALGAGQDPLWVQTDWRLPAFKPGSLDRIWGGDIVYERRFIRPVADFLGHVAAPGAMVWLADPGRNFNEELCALLRTRGWRCETVHEDQAVPHDAPHRLVDVRVWEMARDGAEHDRPSRG